MELSTIQKSAINRIGRQFTDLGGDDFATFIQEQVLDAIESGNIGITADAWDVDSLALGGGHFSKDVDNTSGLNYSYFAGRIFNGKAIVDVAAGTVALTASNTNYVECSRAGVVSKNIVGFTSGAIPLATIVTGVASITSITNKKTFLSAPPNGGISGDLLSTAGKTKSLLAVVGTVSATGDFKIICPNHAATLVRLSIVVDTTITANDTNYWTFSAVNKGPSGSGTTALLASADSNTTKATGGTGITAYIARALTLNGTPANLVTAAGDVLVGTLTKTASASNLVNLVVLAEFTFDV